MTSTKSFIVTLLSCFVSAQSSQKVVSIPSADTYLLLPTYQGNVSTGYIDTITPNASLNALFAAAKSTPFVSYCPKFLSLLGPSPQLTLAAQQSDPFASEGGIWVPARNEVWFTSSGTVGTPVYISVLNLATNAVTVPNLSPPIVNPNGGYFFNGLVYFATLGNASVASGITSIDPDTNQTSTVLNSFFGLPFNGPDDAVVVNKGGKEYLFFSDPDYAQELGTRPQSFLPNAVWRFDAQSQSVQAVVSRDDIERPNGIKVTADGSRMYITDGTLDFKSGPFLGVGSGGIGFGAPVIWEFDLDEEARPVNKKLFGLARAGIADGILVDDFGNVWTAEKEGIVVRDSTGKVIGLFNAQAILAEPDTHHIANFGLAGDTLVILASTQIFTVKLATVVVGPGRFSS
ncbi:hypothetical protein MMC28_001229 [Mycoblastus sanguinarius]|nr:hypothetical protein [Mycoblastus sanguinarius]